MNYFLVIAILVLSFAAQAQSTRQVMELKPVGKPSSYAQQLADSADGDQSEARLESYLNSLLKTNVIQDPGRQPDEPAIQFTLRVNRGGELLVTRVELDGQQRSIRNRSLLVYGVGSVLDFDCSRQEHRCWVLYPEQNERWLEIRYAPNVAKELATGIGLLIRKMQR